MTNNDILRSIRYTFDFSDPKLVSLFRLGGIEISREQITDWLRKDDDPDYKNCGDKQLAAFLNGLIIDRRGRKEGPQPIPEKRINNNIVFRKLKIALNLQAEEVLAILKLTGLNISKHELSAFFRNPEHKHYRNCNDQIMRNFLKGMQKKYRENNSQD